MIVAGTGNDEEEEPRMNDSYLPRINPDDLKAVRSYFPGKLLARMAAFLGIMQLVLGSAILVDKELRQFIDDRLPLAPWQRFGLLFGLPMLAVGAQLFNEWRAARAKHKLQELAIRPASVSHAYFRIGPYFNTKEDRDRFDRADKAHEKVLSWVQGSTAMPLYLTGDSGTGKSSLLNAYVLPKLRDAGWTVFEARAWQDPEAALRRALATDTKTVAPAADAIPVRGLIEAAARGTEPLLVVLDQFEEFVISEPKERQGFLALIEDLQRRSVARFHLLLVLRSDYQTFLEEIGLPALRQGENFYQISRFTVPAARAFLQASDLQVQPNALDVLVASAGSMDDTPRLIRPITLNVLGHILSTGPQTAPSMDADELVQLYIEQTLSKPAIRDYVRPVLGQLVTGQSTKRPRSEADLVMSTKLGRAAVRGVLIDLNGAGLARPLDAAQGVWELSHDFLAHAVARYIGLQRRHLARRSLLYAAPALLTLMIAGIGLALVYDSAALARMEADLGDLGITLTRVSAGLSGEKNNRLTAESFVQASTLLRKINTRVAISELLLSGSDVNDLSPLEGLTALTNLDLKSTDVSDLGPLRGLTALARLIVFGTSVSDVSPLKSLTALSQLNLSDTQVIDLTPMAGLTALGELLLNDTHVSDLSPLAGLTALATCDLGSTEVTDVVPLKGLTALTYLNLNRTDLSDLGPLGGLVLLTRLDLNNTKITDLNPLRGLAALAELDISDTNVADLSPLKGLTKLTTLDLRHTKVTDLSPLQDLPNLQNLIARDVPDSERTRFRAYRANKGL
jgi:Leucine-rich repeat (LRR) protein